MEENGNVELEYLIENAIEWYWDMIDDGSEMVTVLFVKFGNYWYWMDGDQCVGLVSYKTVNYDMVDIIWDMWFSGLITNDIPFDQWERIVGDTLTKWGY